MSGGSPLADKLAPLIVSALRKAAVDRTGLLLYASRSEPGLFPATALGKQAADRACAADKNIFATRKGGDRLAHIVNVIAGTFAGNF